MRKTTGSAALLLAAMGAAMPAAATAIGLGGLQVQSDLFRPFQARIPMHDLGGLRAEDIRIGLASAGEFQRFGLERPHALQKLEFRYSERDGEAHIEILGRTPQREPVMQFLINIEWPGGRLLREYTALLDPPGWEQTHAAPAITVAAAGPSAADATASPRPSAPASPEDSYGPVRSGETLGAIARGYVVTGADLNQVMLALLRANPRAFAEVAGEANMNLLQRGATLRLPDDDELRAVDAGTARSVVLAQYRAFRGQRTRSAEPEVGADDGPAVAGDGASGTPADEPVAESAAQAASGGQLRLLAEGQAPRVVTAETPIDEADLRQQVIDLRRIAELKDEQIAAVESALLRRDAELAKLRTLAELHEAELRGLHDELDGLRVKITGATASPAPEAAAGQALAGVAATAPLAQRASDDGRSGVEWILRLLRSPLSVLLAVPALLGLLWHLRRRRGHSRDQLSDESEASAVKVSTYRADQTSELRATVDWLRADELSGDALGVGSAVENAESKDNDDAAWPTTAGGGSDNGSADSGDDASASIADDAVAKAGDEVLAAPGEAVASAREAREAQHTDLHSQLPEAEARLLEEIDVYLAYGLYDQAAELIGRGLEREPGKPALLARRLEAVLLDGQPKQFTALCAEYRESISDADWARLAERAASLDVAMPDRDIGTSTLDQDPAVSGDKDGAPAVGGVADRSSRLLDLEPLDHLASDDGDAASLDAMYPDLPALHLHDADPTLALDQPEEMTPRRAQGADGSMLIDAEDEPERLIGNDEPDAEVYASLGSGTAGQAGDGDRSLLEKLGAGDFMLDDGLSEAPQPADSPLPSSTRRQSGN